MKKIFILLLFIVSSCGYQSLYKVNKDSDSLKISEVEMIGDKKISKEIYSRLPFILIKDNKLLNRVIIKTKNNTIEASKNSKGQTTSYRTTLTAEIKLINNKGDIVEEKSSQKYFSYNADENKFKFKEYQKKIEENLINEIVKDIIFFLNYS